MSYAFLLPLQVKFNKKLDVLHAKFRKLYVLFMKDFSLNAFLLVPGKKLITCVPLIMTVCAGRLTPHAKVAVDTNT